MVREMKETPLIKAINKAVEVKMEAVNRLLKDLVEPLGDVGNPEKLIGKPYEQWSQQDLMMLSKIYGQEPNPLSDLIFKKTYERVKQMEEI